MITFQCSLQQFNDSTHFIPVPVNIAETLLSEGQKRVLCHINETFTLHCALMKSRKVGYYLMISKRVRKEAALNGRTSNYGKT